MRGVAIGLAITALAATVALVWPGMVIAAAFVIVTVGVFWRDRDMPADDYEPAPRTDQSQDHRTPPLHIIHEETDR